MRWSYPLFRVYGISVEAHLTFILFFALIALADFTGAVFLLILFTTVLAHELVHSITAINYGVRVPKITLLPIGGLASIDLPDDPLLELRISIVGPLFNFILGGFSAVMLYLVGGEFIGYESLVDGIFTGSFGMGTVSSVLSLTLYVNLVLGGFNMLPAFPMDGGRVFRSVLALWMDYVKATRIATTVGKFIFLCLAFAGIFTGNLWWVIIGVFLSYAGGGELKYVNLKAILEGRKLEDIAVQKMSYVSEHLSFKEFMSRVYVRGQSIYLVVGSDGVLKKAIDVRELGEVDPEKSVGEARGIGYVVLDGGLPVSKVLKVVLGSRLVLVASKGMFIGHITPELLADVIGAESVIRRLR